MNAPFARAKARPLTEFNSDRHAWAMEQAALLRAGRVAELDMITLAGELDDVVIAEYRRLESALRLLAHILNWEHQPARRGRSWEATIKVQRIHIAKVLRDNSSLNPRRRQAMADAWEVARVQASGETRLPEDAFHAANPYDWSTIMEHPFRYDPPPTRRR